MPVPMDCDWIHFKISTFPDQRINCCDNFICGICHTNHTHNQSNNMIKGLVSKDLLPVCGSNLSFKKYPNHTLIKVKIFF